MYPALLVVLSCKAAEPFYLLLLIKISFRWNFDKSQALSDFYFLACLALDRNAAIKTLHFSNVIFKMYIETEARVFFSTASLFIFLT